jgi:hypothetical protein
MPNNVYADKNGNVLRQTKDGNWQQRDKSGWKPASPGNSTTPRPTTGNTPTPRPAAGGTTPSGNTPAPRPAPGGTTPGGNTPGARPAPTPSGPSTRPAPSNIQGDYQARQRGNESARNYQSSTGSGNRQPPKSQAPRPQQQPKPQQSRPPASHSQKKPR